MPHTDSEPCRLIFFFFNYCIRNVTTPQYFFRFHLAKSVHTNTCQKFISNRYKHWRNENKKSHPSTAMVAVLVARIRFYIFVYSVVRQGQEKFIFGHIHIVYIRFPYIGDCVAVYYFILYSILKLMCKRRYFALCALYLHTIIIGIGCFFLLFSSAISANTLHL